VFEAIKGSQRIILPSIIYEAIPMFLPPKRTQKISVIKELEKEK
jgi:hypothetical protein